MVNLFHSNGFRMSLSLESRLQNISKLGLKSFLTSDISTINDTFHDDFQGSILSNVLSNGFVKSKKELIELSSYLDKELFFRNFRFKDLASVGLSVYLTIEWEIMDATRKWVESECYVCIKISNDSLISKMNIFMNEMKTYKPKAKLRWSYSLPRIFKSKGFKNIPKEHDKMKSEDDLDISRHAKRNQKDYDYKQN